MGNCQINHLDSKTNNTIHEYNFNQKIEDCQIKKKIKFWHEPLSYQTSFSIFKIYGNIEARKFGYAFVQMFFHLWELWMNHLKTFSAMSFLDFEAFSHLKRSFRNQCAVETVKSYEWKCERHSRIPLAFCSRNFVILQTDFCCFWNI